MQVEDLERMFPDVDSESVAKAYIDVRQILEKAKVDKVYTYCFYWDADAESQFYMKIKADKETVENLLNVYRALDDNYNNVDWLNFLETVGIEAELIPEADYYIYF